MRNTRNTRIDLGGMWDLMKKKQIESMKTKAAATWANLPDAIDEEEEEEMDSPKKRVVLPLRRTYSYGRNLIRHTLDDEECESYNLTMRGIAFKTLPSQSLHKWI